MFLHKLCARSTTADAPSVMPEEFPAVMVPSSKTRATISPTSPMLAPRNGCSSRENVRRTFFALDGHRRDLVVEAPGVNGLLALLLRVQRELVLLFASDLVLLGQNLGRLAHHHLRHRTEKSVAIHSVDQFLIAHAQSPARAIEIIRKARHRLRSAREHTFAGCRSGSPDIRARWTSFPKHRPCSPCKRQLLSEPRCGWKSAARHSARRRPGERCRRSSLPPAQHQSSARSIAALAATTPMSAAVMPASVPPNFPIGVRAPERIKTSLTDCSSTWKITLQFSSLSIRLSRLMARNDAVLRAWVLTSAFIYT